MEGALAGYRILDLSRVLAGPFGTMLLADLGAEVIKIEPPEGDFSRGYPPYFHKGQSLYFMSINRNKKSMTLNLKSARGRDVFHDLAKGADVVFDNFRPGVVEKLGVDYETLKEMNPGIVCCSISGYGSSGPLRDAPAFDLILQARGGAMSLTGEPGKAFYRMGIPLGDLAGGMFAAQGVMAALLARARTGKGQRLEVSLLDAQISLLTYHAANYLFSGEVPPPLGTGHNTLTPIRGFRTSDGFLVLDAAIQKFWIALCRALDRPELASDPRFETSGLRLTNRPELYAIMEEIFLTRTTVEWLAVLEAHEVPAAPINNLDLALSEPQVLQRHMVVEVDHNLGGRVRMAGNPIKLSATPGETFTSPPVLGEHTGQILGELLGYDEAQIRSLREEGVV